MTLAELQALIMAQAVAKLDRLKVRRAEIEQAEQDPKAERPRGWQNLDWIQGEIDDQEILIAKLTYTHEREQAELERDEYMRNLERARLVADIDEKAQLIEYRKAVLVEFKRGNEIQIKGHDIQKAGLAAIAEAIQGRAPL